MTTTSDVNIRTYQSGDEYQIVNLLTKTFPKWSTFKNPLSLWKWKYIETPYKTLIIVALDGDKIIGCDHVVIFKAKIGTKTTTLGYSDDLAIDTEYRGRGIWNGINKLKSNKILKLAEFTYETTINPIVMKSWSKRNRKLFPFRVTRMIKTTDINFLLKERLVKNTWLYKIGYQFLKMVNKIENMFKTASNKIDDFNIVDVFNFDERINVFWDKIEDDYSFILEKNQEYLNWRYVDNERGNHIKLQAVRDGDVLGFAVIGYKLESSEGQIIDLLVFNDRLDIAESLFEECCRYLDELNINTIYFQIVEGHPYYYLSRRKGFINSRSRPMISFDYGATYLVNQENTDLTVFNNVSPERIDFTYSTTI